MKKLQEIEKYLHWKEQKNSWILKEKDRMNEKT